MISRPHIVSTRILNSATVEKLKAEGWKFTMHNFISKQIVLPENIKESIHEHVVLTSKTGVEAFLKLTQQSQPDKIKYNLFCVAHATKELALRSGLRIKASAPNASALAEEILKDASVKSVTHICSNLRRNELSEKLTKAGVQVHEVVAYKTEFTPVVVEQPYEAILFFSPSAVDSFLSRNTLQPVPCFCIGNTTEAHAKQKGYPQTHIPDAPEEEAVLNVMIRYFSKNPAHAKK
jgi:uroporphyrinogen-III synthase